jgi:hypothetical protein
MLLGGKMLEETLLGYSFLFFLLESYVSCPAMCMYGSVRDNVFVRTVSSGCTLPIRGIGLR